MFRDGPALRAALDRPFTSRWIFDVELLGRLSKGPAPGGGLGRDEFLEVPLVEWCDQDGSKLRPIAAVAGAADLVRVAGRCAAGRIGAEPIGEATNDYGRLLRLRSSRSKP